VFRGRDFEFSNSFLEKMLLSFQFSLFTQVLMPARIKIIAAIYIFILAGIIVLADVRETQFLFGFIRRLPFGDKLGHFFLMGMFSLVLNLALSAREIRVWKLKYLLGSLIVLNVVAAEEFSQLFIGGRTFDAGDLLADAAGILIFGELARELLKRKLTFHGSKIH
jgi:hypothetical protein